VLEDRRQTRSPIKNTFSILKGTPGPELFSGQDWAKSVVTPENDAVNIRPELFKDIEKPIEGNLRQPLLLCFGPGTLFGGVIEIGDTRSCPVANDFRKIECPTA
jgi:hypothetical protein